MRGTSFEVHFGDIVQQLVHHLNHGSTCVITNGSAGLLYRKLHWQHMHTAWYHQEQIVTAHLLFLCSNAALNLLHLVFGLLI